MWVAMVCSLVLIGFTFSLYLRKLPPVLLSRAVGERRLNLAKSLRSNVMRWHDAKKNRNDRLVEALFKVEWCRSFPLLPLRIVISQNK